MPHAPDIRSNEQRVPSVLILPLDVHRRRSCLGVVRITERAEPILNAERHVLGAYVPDNNIDDIVGPEACRRDVDLDLSESKPVEQERQRH